jgi:serine protease Do
VGADPDTDLAVLRVDADRLHEAKFGDSDAMEVGDDVLALGNPFGLTGTVSKGIISAKGRSPVAVAEVTYKGFLQTDASINPGNSGGPLVNLRGEIIGINTAIASETGRYEGVGFAIPSSRVQALLPKLVKGETIVRGFMGISLVGVAEYPDYAREVGYKRSEGIVITGVVADSGADQANLRAEDIVVELAGRVISDAESFREDVAQYPPGAVVPLTVWRDGEMLAVDVTLGRRLER